MGTFKHTHTHTHTHTHIYIYIYIYIYTHIHTDLFNDSYVGSLKQQNVFLFMFE